jgi:hypothetical protein
MEFPDPLGISRNTAEEPWFAGEMTKHFSLETKVTRFG